MDANIHDRGRLNDVVSPVPSSDGVLSVPGRALAASPEVELQERTPAAEGLDSARRFRSIVDQHFAFIWRALRGLGIPAHSVDDAAQQVFLVTSRKLADIPVGNERAFLFGTALGVAANARRSRARSREVLDEEALRVQADDAPNGEELCELRERRALLDRVLAEMPDDLRVVFVLFVLEGLTAAAISKLLEIAPGTVASRLRRARESFHAISKRVQAREGRGGSR
jgi:RNA polymerase sigma-70 factor, ECF subfamily